MDFSAVIFAVGPPDAPASNVSAAQVNAFHLGMMHVDFVFHPRFGHLRNGAAIKFEAEVVLDPVGPVEVGTQGGLDQVEQGAGRQVLVVISKFSAMFLEQFDTGTM